MIKDWQKVEHLRFTSPQGLFVVVGFDVYISYSYFITLNSTLFSVHLDLRELLP